MKPYGSSLRLCTKNEPANIIIEKLFNLPSGYGILHVTFRYLKVGGVDFTAHILNDEPITYVSSSYLANLDEAYAMLNSMIKCHGLFVDEW